jgi:hydroxyethylthiazole kinase-like uncharacterized protein yjeF
VKVKAFDVQELKQLYIPPEASSGEDNGQITIIGGSRLFHGPTTFALKASARIVDMVFFASPEESLRDVSAHLKASVAGFIWVPWDEVEDYIQKSDAILIGSGFMRFRSEKVPYAERSLLCDDECLKTQKITHDLLTKFPDKKWVIDAGSLQVMEPEWIPENAVITPNNKEYKMLFGALDTQEAAEKYKCVIVRKGKESLVCSPEGCVLVNGGNAGMTKGGTGDVLAGVTVALLAKNDPFLAASAAAYITKKAGESLKDKMGYWYSAEDLSEAIAPTFTELLKV